MAYNWGMTWGSRQETDELKWVSFVLFLAALYNLVWGTVAAIAPVQMLAFAGIANPEHPEFWQCLGMFVGLYGICYWCASTDPVRYWPFVLIGLVGKVLGPIGAVRAISAGTLPSGFLWVNVTNDFIWWIPFGWSLRVVQRWNRSVVRDARAETSLYRRLTGPAFEELTPSIRRFHDARGTIEVSGTFDLKRGDSALGNWLTDRAQFPGSQNGLPVSLVVEPTATGEIWYRKFAGTVIQSAQFESYGLLAERFGPLVIYLQPRVVAGALEITDVRSTLFGVPLPPFATPRVWARGVDGGAGIDVAVRISCSPLGGLVEYAGTVAFVQGRSGRSIGFAN